MTPNEFVHNALRTESRIDSIKTNIDVLNDTIHAIIALSEILDQMKKHIFYGKPYALGKLDEAIRSAKDCISGIDMARPNFPRATNDREMKINPRIFHAIIGIATESAELLQALSYDHIDRVNILEEFGDLCWYQAIGVDALGADLEVDVLDKIIAKLRARYPDKFTNEQAINRDVAKERAILEGRDTLMDAIEVPPNSNAIQ